MSHLIKIQIKLKTLISPRLIAVLILNISSGIPMALLTITLMAWLHDQSVSIETIGLLALTTQPYVFKILWAPFVDKINIPLLSIFSRRKDWIILMQCLLILSIMYLGIINPFHHTLLTGILSLLIAIFSATQDIAINAYQTDILNPSERGLAAVYTLIGYRVGMLIAGAGLLILSEIINWKMAFWSLGGVILFCLICTAFLPRINIINRINKNNINKKIKANLKLKSIWNNIIWAPFKAFLNKYPKSNWIIILCFIILYKFGDAMAMSLNTPFLQTLGFTNIDIGSISKAFGLAAILLGAFFGGILMKKITLKKALWSFGWLQLFSNIGFLILSYTGKSMLGLALSIAAENFCSGLGTAAFLACIMSLCDKEFSGTQFALFTAISALGRTYLAPISGLIVSYTNWHILFFIAFIIGLPGILLIKKLPCFEKK